MIQFQNNYYADIRVEDRFSTVISYKDGTLEEMKTREERQAWIATHSGVTVGSDAFFPFGDNVERARKSGAAYIVEPGGSIRDDHVIETCNKYGIVMSFTGMRLFHH